MMQSRPQFALSDNKAGQATLRSINRRFRSRRKIFRATTTNENSRSLIDGHCCRLPQFLASRIGLLWAQLLADLRSVAPSEAEYLRLLHLLADFVEINVTGSSDELRHGSGLLIGQPLTAGWRRRLYVCPVSERLLPIAEHSVLEYER